MPQHTVFNGSKTSGDKKEGHDLLLTVYKYSLESKVFLCLPNMKRCMTGTDQNGLFMNRRILQDERGVNSEMILPPVAKYAQTCILEEMFPPWKLKLARTTVVVRSKLIPRPFRSHDVGYSLWGFFFRGLP